jgi:hypothetical protein
MDGMASIGTGEWKMKMNGSRCSEVSKWLRNAWHEAAEFSGVRLRVDGQRRRLSEQVLALLQATS